jgi:hypothetical protein
MPISEAIRLLWIKDILKSRRVGISINDFLKDITNYSINYVNGDEIELYIFDFSKLVAIFLEDASKFSAGAFETITDIAEHPVLRESLAWPTVMSYYSGFYAVHGLLRLTGVSCARILSESASQINRLARRTGALTTTSSTMSGGYFRATFDSSTGTLKLKKKAEKMGTHQFLWHTWEARIRDIVSAVNSSPLILTSDKIKMSQDLNNLIAAIQTNRGSNINSSWFSDVRNNTNYAMDYSVWYPYNRRPGSYDDLLPLLSRWRSNPDDDPLDITQIATVPVVASIKSHKFMTSLLFATIKDIRQRLQVEKHHHAISNTFNIIDRLG